MSKKAKPLKEGHIYGPFKVLAVAERDLRKDGRYRQWYVVECLTCGWIGRLTQSGIKLCKMKEVTYCNQCPLALQRARRAEKRSAKPIYETYDPVSKMSEVEKLAFIRKWQ